MKIEGKKCLVTGGAGFIGSHLVDSLIEAGCFVRVLDNLSNGKINNLARHLKSHALEFIKGDITDLFDIRNAMKDIEVVFHLACLGVRHSIAHPFENHRVNSEGSLFLLEAAYRENVERFIYTSSSEVYGSAQFVPMTEMHPTMPCTVYGASKLSGEAYTRAFYSTYGMPTVVIRPFNSYGPRSHHEGDAGEFIPKSIVRVLNGKDIIVFGDGSQTRDFTYVKDTANAIMKIAEIDDAIGATFNVGSGFEIAIKELACKISEMITGSIEKVKFAEDRPGDVRRLFAFPEKFNNFCGWKPEVGFEEGLVKTIDFFKSHPSDLRDLLREAITCNW
jgi:UDP-glucose 4-epimerase